MYHAQERPVRRVRGRRATWATIASLLATARLNDVDPNGWLTQTLERIATGWLNKDIDALLPQNFARP
jgi:transposase